MSAMEFQAIRPIAGQERTKSSAITEPQQSGIPFYDVLQGAVENLALQQELSAQDAYQLALGQSPDLHTLMIRSAIEETSVQTAVELTSRAISAYKEIMQMQI